MEDTVKELGNSIRRFITVLKLTGYRVIRGISNKIGKTEKLHNLAAFFMLIGFYTLHLMFRAALVMLLWNWTVASWSNWNPMHFMVAIGLVSIYTLLHCGGARLTPEGKSIWKMTIPEVINHEIKSLTAIIARHVL